MNTYIVFDCETTGLTLPSCAHLNDQPRIIEVGLTVISGKDRKSYSQLINPEFPITDEITKITGIKESDIKKAPTFKAVLPTLRKFFVGAGVFVAHNAPFDASMLQYSLDRVGCKDFPWPSDIRCTVQEFHHLFGRDMKMTELYEFILNKELKQTHRALEDVDALVEILDHEGYFI